MHFTMAGNMHTMWGIYSSLLLNGTILACVINALGFWHDSQIADYGHFYDKLKLMFLEYHAKPCIDSAFALNQHK